MLEYHLRCEQFHVHGKLEGAATVFAVGRYRDLATTVLDNSLADCQTKTDALHVHVLRSLCLAKLFEEHGHLAIVNALACVDHVHDQLLRVVVEGRQNMNVAL